VFSVNNDVEESITRSEDISMDYDFFHSQLLALSCGNDYEVKIIPKDINIWISRLFLGDADGFSILYYQDDGFAYWVNSGFEVDTENGVSGTASFKAVGVPGMTKSLSQTVYPATRKSYTFSAQIASENLEKGENGQVGVEIVIEYEDGTTETRFIDLI
jgi:hypothetical protein